MARPAKYKVRSLEERFDTLHVEDPATGCWLWTGSRSDRGYGLLNKGGKHIRAHRLSYQLFHGPIPRGLSVCHDCDRPACVNPKHLYAGTHQENMRDKVARGRAARGEAVANHGAKNGNSKLSEDDVRRIIRLRTVDRLNLRAIADIHNVSVNTVWQIARGDTWKHLHRPLRNAT